MMNCRQVVNDSNISFKDNGNAKCQLIYLNPTRVNVTRYRVDGCLITEGQKCDFKMDCPNFEHYIEIKGKDIYHACDQIEATINQLSINSRTYPKKSFVIATGVPTINGKIQIITKKFSKSYNSTLKIKTRKHTETL